MKATVLSLALLMALLQVSHAVIVMEGDFAFPLEVVKVLWALMPAVDTAAEAAAVCSHPSLPQDFKPLCLREDAGAALLRLAQLASHVDACEICASVACIGCGPF